MSLGQQAKEKYYDRIDIAQLVVSILVFFLCLLWIGLVGMAGFGQVITNYGTTALAEPGTAINSVLTGLVFLVIAFVSIVTTIQKITGHARSITQNDDRVMIWFIAGILLVFGLAALAGLAPAKVNAIALTVLAVPGIVIPVFWLLRIGDRGRKTLNLKRDAGILTFSIGISTPFITLVELLVVIFLLIVFVAGLFNNPQFTELFNSIMSNPGVLQNDPGRLFSEFKAMLNLQDLLGWPLLLFAGIVPLVEELFKTLGVWLLQVRNPDPKESFRLGLISGGGFALFEGLMSVRSIPLGEVVYTDWAGLILGRFGGSLLHILAGGIIGLAIGKFWKNRKFAPLLLSYLAAWLLHAAWNFLAFFGGVYPLINQDQVQAVWPYIALVLLFLGMVFVFLRLVRKVQSTNDLQVYPSGSEG